MFKTTLLTSEELDAVTTFACEVFAKREPMCVALGVEAKQLRDVVGSAIRHSLEINKAFLLKARVRGQYQTIGFLFATQFDFEPPSSVLQNASEEIQSIFTFLDLLSEKSSHSVDVNNTYLCHMIGISLGDLASDSKIYKKILGSLAGLYFVHSIHRRLKKTDLNKYFVGLVTGEKSTKYAEMFGEKIGELSFRGYFCPIKETHCFDNLNGSCYYYIGTP